MTVDEAIKLLMAFPDKQMEMLIDCPHCGRGNQLARIDEAVILRGDGDGGPEEERGE